MSSIVRQRFGAAARALPACLTFKLQTSRFTDALHLRAAARFTITNRCSFPSRQTPFAPTALTIPPRRSSLHWSPHVFSTLSGDVVRSRAVRHLCPVCRDESHFVVLDHRAGGARRARPVRSDAAASRNSA